VPEKHHPPGTGNGNGTPDWQDIRIFVTVAGEGTVTAAAVRMGLTGATVSRRLKALEAECGVKLFIRRSNRLELTAAGRAFLEAARPLQAASDGVTRLLETLRQPKPRQALRVSATGSVALVLAQAWGDLTAQADLPPVDLLADRTPANLARGEADIALRMRRLPEEGDLIARRLGAFGFTLYARPDGLTADGKPIRLILPARPWRTGSQPDRLWQALEERNLTGAGEGAGEEAVQMALHIDHPALRLAAIRSGGGAGLLPCFTGDRATDLVRVLPPPASLCEDVYMMTHRSLGGLPGLASLTAALTGWFSRNRGALTGV
jgi:DNA-binding transcriptional LysR family regulator